MAVDEIERRADTVAISRATANRLVALGAAILLGVAGVLWGVVRDSIRMAQQITYLEKFGPGTGKRFTYEDGQELREMLREMHRDHKKDVERVLEIISVHVAQGAHQRADQRLDELERNADQGNRRQYDQRQ